MVNAGILGHEDPVWLCEGVVVIKGDSTMAPGIQVADGRTRDGRELPGISVPVPVRRFSVDEYERLFAAKILGDEDRVELLEGWIVQKMTRHPPHDTSVSLVMKAMVRLLPHGWFCRVQLTLATDLSNPEPDVMVVRGTERDYAARHPRPRDTGLVVEVADTSLATDRELKGLLYARVGIPTYWIVNVVDHVVEVYTAPSGTDPSPEYGAVREYRGDDLVPVTLDGETVFRLAARDLLP
jgi:Uma2 family endonuclease